MPSMPFFPHFFLRDMVGWYIALGLLAALAALFPWELGQKADPFGSAPPGIKPEWYFLFMFETLKELPGHILGLEGEFLGVMFFNLCGLMVLLVPFVDFGASRGRARRCLNLLATAAVIGFIVMTYRGLLRDPPGPPHWTVLQVAVIGLIVIAIWGIIEFAGARRGLPLIILATILAGATVASAQAPEKGPPPAPGPAPVPLPKENVPLVVKENKCLACHGDAELWEGDRERFHITEKDLAKDIHWQKGLRCYDCHGGDPTTTKSATSAHSLDAKLDGKDNPFRDQIAQGYSRVLRPLPLQYRLHAPLSALAAHGPGVGVLDQRPRQAAEGHRGPAGRRLHFLPRRQA